jgi:hypothetical protein
VKQFGINNPRSNDFLVEMVFSFEYRILINNLVLLKNYGTRRLLKEFPQKKWSKGGLEKLLRKIRSTGSINRQSGSGRPRSAQIQEIVETVQGLALSQEDAVHNAQKDELFPPTARTGGSWPYSV